jgi:ribonuclease HI
MRQEASQKRAKLKLIQQQEAQKKRENKRLRLELSKQNRLVRRAEKIQKSTDEVLLRAIYKHEGDETNELTGHQIQVNQGMSSGMDEHTDPMRSRPFRAVES